MRLAIRKPCANFVDFLVVGAAKCGTTSLDRYLRQHPQIFLPEIKELHFWEQNRNPNKAIRCFSRPYTVPTSLLDYLSWFESAAEGQVVGEVCPSYLYYHDLAIASLKDYHPAYERIKIAAILRDPIDRIFSGYRHVRRKELDPEDLDFVSSIRMEPLRKDDPELVADLLYVDMSRYYGQVKAYLENFENVRVYLFEDLRDDARGLLADLFGFLGVDEAPAATVDTGRRANVTKGRAVPRAALHRRLYEAASAVGAVLPGWMRRVGKRLVGPALLRPLDPEMGRETRETVELLKDQLRPDVEALSELIGRDLSHWLSRDYLAAKKA